MAIEPRVRLRLELALRIGMFVADRELGRVIPSDRVPAPSMLRGADVGFLSYDRLPKGTRISDAVDVLPELIFEIRYSDAPWRPMLSRIVEHLDSGILRVGIVDLGTQTIRIYSAEEPETVATIDQEVDLSPILAGLRLPVRELLHGSLDPLLIESVHTIFCRE